MNAKYGLRQSEYDLRPRRPRDYSHLHATLEGITMTQHSMKKGIKLFGQAGVDAVSKELQQLYDHKVLEPKSPDQISSADKKDALQYLMFLKKKRNGIIKGGGMRQWTQATCIHCKGGRQLSYGSNQIRDALMHN
jgi:hypothetical protein